MLSVVACLLDQTRGGCTSRAGRIPEVSHLPYRLAPEPRQLCTICISSTYSTKVGVVSADDIIAIRRDEV